jgi:hypothetical protein
MDPLDLVGGQADRDELGQPRALADNAQRTVTRVDQPAAASTMRLSVDSRSRRERIEGTAGVFSS